MALAIKAVDHPNERKKHTAAIPRLGGVAIAIGLLFGVSTVGLMWQHWEFPLERQAVVSLSLGTFLIFLLGVVDDLIGVSAWKKLLIELIAALPVVQVGWQFHELAYPGGAIHLGPLSGALTMIWIVGVTNAINLIDGLDGLASGVVAIIGLSLLIYSMAYQSPVGVVLTAGMVGSCLGFLPHNWEPARIFMGDSGSLTLGYLLGTLSVYTTLKSPAAVAILVPILALGVPVIDTLLVMLVRFLERPKGVFTRRFLRMFHADRNHLHHLMEVIVGSRRPVVYWVYGMVLVSCSMALIVALTKRSGLGLILLAVELGAVAAVRRLGLAKKARSIARRQREESAELRIDAQ
ncbi:MAG TPA: MraY family glycosyltransferase [Acidobacteriota bacterium]|nr:MraY family glycosyltransferase [Acidobacteriota bacterium]